MNLLIIGNIAAGKSTLSKTICQVSDNFDLENYHSIDNLRKEYSDGTYAGEFRAWSKMLEYMQYSLKENEIFEFSGTGKNTWFVREIIKESDEEWLVIYCSCNKNVLLKRAKERIYDIPIPYNLGAPEATYSFVSKNLKSKFGTNYWCSEEMVVQTDKFPPVILAKQVLDKIKEL